MNLKGKKIKDMTRNELLEKIRQETNKLNRKLRQFHENDVVIYEQIIEEYLGDKVNLYEKLNEYTELDFTQISKSKKQFENTSDLDLQIIASSMVGLNKYGLYKDYRTYKKEVNIHYQRLHEYILGFFCEKYYYDRQELMSLISRKDFTEYLFEQLKASGGVDPSDQIINDVIITFRNMSKDNRTQQKNNESLNRNIENIMRNNINRR